METHFTQGKLIIRNENVDIHHKRKENYKGEEREAKKSKFECGAKAVVDETSKPSKTIAEKGDEGLGSPNASNDITKKSTLPAEASLKEYITLEEALNDPAYRFLEDHKCCCIDDFEEEESHEINWFRRTDIPFATKLDFALKYVFG